MLLVREAARASHGSSSQGQEGSGHAITSWEAGKRGASCNPQGPGGTERRPGLVQWEPGSPGWDEAPFPRWPRAPAPPGAQEGSPHAGPAPPQVSAGSKGGPDRGSHPETSHADHWGSQPPWDRPGDQSEPSQVSLEAGPALSCDSVPSSPLPGPGPSPAASRIAATAGRLRWSPRSPRCGSCPSPRGPAARQSPAPPHTGSAPPGRSPPGRPGPLPSNQSARGDSQLRTPRSGVHPEPGRGGKGACPPSLPRRCLHEKRETTVRQTGGETPHTHHSHPRPRPRAYCTRRPRAEG